LPERKAQIEALRARSQSAIAGKTMDAMDANPEAVLDAFARHGVRRIIHGHTHRPALHRYTTGDDIELERWVLPEWHSIGGYLACDAQGCRPLAFPEV
jgi:UDP-2,3-diacylglucosamine hydrolase